MVLRDYYATLGVGKTADQQKIKAAYKKLIRKHHPDKTGLTGDAEIFRSIQEAYEVLSSPEKRQEYDAVGHEFYVKRGAADDQQQGERTAADAFSSDDISEVFSNLFGGGLGMRQGAAMKADAIQASDLPSPHPDLTPPPLDCVLPG